MGDEFRKDPVLDHGTCEFLRECRVSIQDLVQPNVGSCLCLGLGAGEVDGGVEAVGGGVDVMLEEVELKFWGEEGRVGEVLGSEVGEGWGAGGFVVVYAAFCYSD